MTKLYAGGLSSTATDETTYALSADHGPAEKVPLITERDCRHPHGFEFVEISSVDTSRTMQRLNDTDLDGCALKMNQAQERFGGAGRSGPGQY